MYFSVYCKIFSKNIQYYSLFIKTDIWDNIDDSDLLPYTLKNYLVSNPPYRKQEKAAPEIPERLFLTTG